MQNPPPFRLTFMCFWAKCRRPRQTTNRINGKTQFYVLAVCKSVVQVGMLDKISDNIVKIWCHVVW